MRSRARRLGWVVSLVVACGGNGGGTGTTDGGTGTTDGGSSTTDGGSSDASTGTSPTTTEASTTGTSGTVSGTDSESTGSTSTGSSTGVDVSGFDFFRLSSAAGPCPPDNDCDGFIELLSNGLLRVEVFGDVNDAVVEVQISEQDFLAAAMVFAHPELVTVLDGPDPLCQPPTDIFESMELQIEGVLHDATTTACGQAPLVAARETAQALRMQYVP